MSGWQPISRALWYVSVTVCSYPLAILVVILICIYLIPYACNCTRFFKYVSSVCFEVEDEGITIYKQNSEFLANGHVIYFLKSPLKYD